MRSRQASRPYSCSVVRAFALLATLAGLCAPLTPASAQWIDYPTHGGPRTKGGAPDLTAKAPRTHEGRPDLSGVWYAAEVPPEGTFDFTVLPPELVADAMKAGAFPPGPPPDDPCLKGGCITQEPFPLDGANMGRSLPGKTLPYQPWARQFVLQQMAVMSKDDPHARCVPPSYPRAFSLPQHWKIVQTKELIVLLHEFNASYRQIFLDGRPLPVDPQPGWNGYSTAHWEKDTLVVQTAGFRDNLWLDILGSPLTSAARVTERFQRVNYGTLNIQVTVDDPRAYTEPWTVTLQERLIPNTDLLEDICVENERSNRLLDDDGKSRQSITHEDRP